MARTVVNLVKQEWILLAILALVAVAGFTVYRLHGVFGGHDAGAVSNLRADDVKPFHPKHVTLEVYGASGAVADINYLDINAVPQQDDGAHLPWSYTAATTAPAVSVNVVAQGDSAEIGCRITVDGVVRDQRTAEGVNAQTFCLVKSA